MRSLNRKAAVLLMLAGAVLCIVFFCIGLYFTSIRNSTEQESSDQFLRLEMQVGEEYDLREYLGKQGGKFTIFNTGTYYRSTSKGISLGADGKLRVHQPGLFNFEVSVRFDDALFFKTKRQLIQMQVLVHDYEFTDYQPVKSYGELANTTGGKYILACDIAVDDRTAESLPNFSGILVNPEGYSVTIYDNLPLFDWVYEGSIICGLNVRAGEKGFHWQHPAESPMGGIIAFHLSYDDVICDSKVEADIYGDMHFNGMVGENHGLILRSEFTGTRFNLGFNANIYNSFAIADGGNIIDCRVYADAYRGESRIAAERVNFYPVEIAALSVGTTPSTSLDGTKVFDLTGEHEMKLDQTVEITSGFRANPDFRSPTQKILAGGVAELPWELLDYISEEGAILTGYSDSKGREYAPTESCFVTGTEEFEILLDAKYAQTSFKNEFGGILYIYPADTVVEIPAGRTVSNTINFGIFSPDQVTLHLASDVQTEKDILFIKGNRMNADSEVEVSLDLRDSQVYEQREDGVYRRDDGKLCRYDGRAENGTLTIPDGITQVSQNPFGALVFDTLDTNDLREFHFLQAEWLGNVSALRVGAALDIGASSSLSVFPALESVEAETRSDGYYTDDGILYRNDGQYMFVPCAYAAGDTLTLRNKSLFNGALEGNLADTIVLENISAVAPAAFDWAECREVIVRGSGETLIDAAAFRYCNQLVRFVAESAVKLNSGAFTDCAALETLELNENICSIAYDTVKDCANFTGYTQAEGCDKFVLSDGILFINGEALLHTKWMQEHATLTVPDGISALTLRVPSKENAEQKFNTVLLGGDVESVSAIKVPAAAFELTGESKFLSVQDGVLLNADATKLLVYPMTREAETYVVPDTVREIAEYAFANVTGIGEIVLGSATEKIGAHAFENTQFSKIVFPETLLEMGDYAFYSAKLPAIRLPDGLESVGEYTFSFAEMQSIVLPSGLKEIPKDMFSKSNIRTLVIPEGVQSVGERAFYSSDLEEISLPESLLSIGENAFAHTKLERVILGKNLAEVGASAFYNCSLLTTVIARNVSIAYGKNCFLETPFLKEGVSAENGVIYLGNTMFGLFGEGESVEVKYGTSEIQSLESIRVKTLKLPATLEKIPSFESLPYLEQLWLGVVPQGTQESAINVNTPIFKAKSDHLYIYFPKHVTFGGRLGEDVYICYDGTPEDFAQYAKLDNIDEFYDRVYYTGTDLYNTWYLDSDGKMCLRSRTSRGAFSYRYSYDEEGLVCEITGYDPSYGKTVRLPDTDHVGQKISVLSGLCAERLDEVYIEGVEVRFSGDFNAEKLYIAENCTVTVITDSRMEIKYLYIDAPIGLVFPSSKVENIIAGQSVKRLYFYGATKVFYEGTPEQWEEVETNSLPYAYWSQTTDFPADGNLYYYYYSEDIPVIWNTEN